MNLLNMVYGEETERATDLFLALLVGMVCVVPCAHCGEAGYETASDLTDHDVAH